MTLIKNEALEHSKCELQFSIDAETFKKAVNAAYNREKGKYTVPGFRKGKAPRHLIEKMVGGEIFHEDAANDLFPAAFVEAAKEAGIEPVGRPDAEIVTASLEEGLVLKAVVAVKPEVTLGEYAGLKAVKNVQTVADSDIDAKIEELRERNARLVTRDGAAQNGDTTKIDFEGFHDGVAFEGGKGEDFDLELGSNSFIPGFEEQIVGHSAGEQFDIDVTFPEAYHAEELAGQSCTFKINLKEVQYKDLPAADDEFVKDVSEYDTMDELRASIRKEMEERADKNAALKAENDLVDQVVAGMKADIPVAMYEERLDELMNDFAYRLSQSGLNLPDFLKYSGKSMEDFREEHRTEAEQQVKIRLALEAVAKAENIQISDEEYEAELQRMADAYKVELEKVREIVLKDEVIKDMSVNKAVDLIKEKAEITTNMVGAAE